MFPVKREPSDTVDLGTDSRRIRCMDNNPHISDTLNINTSDNWPDRCLSKDMVITVAYVKNKSTSNEFNYNTTDSKGNEEFNAQQLIDINDVKTEKTEVCIDNTPGDVTEEEHSTMMKTKEESQIYLIEEHGIHYVQDISQLDRVGNERT